MDNKSILASRSRVSIETHCGSVGSEVNEMASESLNAIYCHNYGREFSKECCDVCESKTKSLISDDDCTYHDYAASDPKVSRCPTCGKVWR
jgi:hypothetical protein